MPALLLIRHCESVGGPAADAPLSAKGQADALALAAPLKALGIDAVYASPYARAVATVAPTAAACGLDLRIDARLRERDVRFIADRDAFHAHVAAGMADRTFKLAEEESFAETAARGLAALTDIAAAGHRLPAIASHGQAITAILSHADRRFGAANWREMANPHVFFVDFSNGGVAGYRPVQLLA